MTVELKSIVLLENTGAFRFSTALSMSVYGRVRLDFVDKLTLTAMSIVLVIQVIRYVSFLFVKSRRDTLTKEA